MNDLTAARARPGIDSRVGRRRRWVTYGLLVALAVVIAVVIAVIGARKSPAAEQFTLRMRSSAPLSLAACSAELAKYGWHVQGGPPGPPIICRVGQGRAWYHAVLVNRGSSAYPACRATGFDAGGKVVFSGPVFFRFGGSPAGLYATGHKDTAFTWYLPKMTAPVVRYVASCVVNEHPPI